MDGLIFKIIGIFYLMNVIATLFFTLTYCGLLIKISSLRSYAEGMYNWSESRKYYLKEELYRHERRKDVCTLGLTHSAISLMCSLFFISKTTIVVPCALFCMVLVHLHSIFESKFKIPEVEAEIAQKYDPPF